MDGHFRSILCSATFLFNRLNALSASTSITASQLSSLYALPIACIAASIPDSKPAQVWMVPAACLTSSPTILRTHFPIIRRMVSPMPTGLKPLSSFISGTNLQSHNSLRWSLGMFSVHIRLARTAISSASSSDSLPNAFEHSICFQISASNLVGPPDPVVYFADACTAPAIYTFKHHFFDIHYFSICQRNQIGLFSWWMLVL